ncbi:MAG: methylated-DNA--[protein]-cysteine S-methyltransferase [Pseudomonadota bacterium]
MHTDYIDSPVGGLLISATHHAIVNLSYSPSAPSTTQPNAMTERCKQQLNEYFNGLRRDFDVPLELHGTTFQRAVWHALMATSYGAICSYGDIATHIQNPNAVRAVGGANNKNPISIIVPCHRVIGHDGSLTGYAGGLDKKRWLLNHERLNLDSN